MATMKKQWADGPYKLCELVPDTADEARKPFVDAANEMGAVHLGITRWLNTIYIQAPFIPALEVPNFIAYALSWGNLLRVHHGTEETTVFPALEKACQVPGFLAHSVEQHKAFHDPFESFQSYLEQVKGSPELFDGREIQKRIDAFGAILTEHLQDEVTVLASIPDMLPKHMKPQNIDIKKINEEGGKHSMSNMALATDITYFSMNHDVTFDNERFKYFPPAPVVIKFLYTYVTPHLSRASNKFGCCDAYGKPKELLYAPEK